VQLRRAANVATGGVPAAALEGAHPDNLALAVRAARLLRLDVAGVDVLMPDIRTSWLESGATICEVNSQPQLSPHLPAYLLSRLVEKQGRIPVVVVLGRAAEPAMAAWQQALARGGRCLGLAMAGGLWVGGAPVAGAMDSFKGGTALLADPAVEAAMIVAEDGEFLQTGSPVDRIDALILAGPLAAASAAGGAYPEALARTLAGMSARVAVNADCAGWVEAAGRWGESAAPARICAPEAVAALLESVMAEDAA
jgi:cyanophycin synthetase